MSIINEIHRKFSWIGRPKALKSGLYFPTEEVLFLGIPKVMTSTMLRFIISGMDEERRYDADGKELNLIAIRRVVMQEYCLAKRSWFEAQEILQSDSITKFSIVRDPWNRFVSGYFDFFVRRVARNEIAAWQPRVTELAVKNKKELDSGPTIRELLNFFSEANSQSIDPHFLPQSMQIPENLSFEVFKLEESEELNDFLHEAFGRGIGGERSNSTQYRDEVPSSDLLDRRPADFDLSSGVPKLERIDLSSLREPFLDLFGKDYERFNYRLPESLRC